MANALYLLDFLKVEFIITVEFHNNCSRIILVLAKMVSINDTKPCAF